MPPNVNENGIDILKTISSNDAICNFHCWKLNRRVMMFNLRIQWKKKRFVSTVASVFNDQQMIFSHLNLNLVWVK